MFCLIAGFRSAFCLSQATDIPEAKAGTLRATQMSYPRVKAAYQTKWDSISSRLNSLNVPVDQLEVFIRAFKSELELEVWVKQKTDTVWQMYTKYDVIKKSGKSGPKRCQGDHQVPEGFYNQSQFNPVSQNFHLSLGVSYPNASDKFFACKGDPGNAIMIHGAGGSTGCLPISNDAIEELYILCIEAKNSGQKETEIHIFPKRLTDQNLAQLKAKETDVKVHAFWDNLKIGYDWFEAKRSLPIISVDGSGKYIFD